MSLLNLKSVVESFAACEDEELSALLAARPDLLHPVPGDLTMLAMRMSSESSIRAHLHRLDAAQLSTLTAVAQRAAGRDWPAPSEEPATLRQLQAAGLIFPDPRSDHGWAVPARLPHILDSLAAGLSASPHTPLPGQSLPHVSPPRAPGPDDGEVSTGLVENSSLAAVAEVLEDVSELLSLLRESPAATLRSGGVGMRELRRITAGSPRWSTAESSMSARSGSSGQPRGGRGAAADARIGETAWLMELAAASGLLELAEGQAWRPSRLAAPWEAASRAHRHQLLVSGWLLAPRTPMLLRGPHPSSRIAPALGADRQRGDAPQLRRAILETAQRLSRGAAGTRPRLYTLRLPDEELSDAEIMPGALCARMHWDRPLSTARTAHLLPWLVREGERLGLFAMGTLTPAGESLAEEAPARARTREGAEPRPAATTPERPWQHGLIRFAEHLESSLPASVETIMVQSDLTAVATGTLSPTTAAALGDFAQREGSGAVPTFRFGADSLHRGLSRGWTAESITSWLEEHSLTPLPSSLRTQIEDAARSWRGVEIGSAGAWLKVSDARLRDTLLADPRLRSLGLRRLDEEVLVADADVAQLNRALHNSGVHAVREATVPQATTGRDPAAPSIAWSLEKSPWEHSAVRTPGQQGPGQDAALRAAAVAALRRAGPGTQSASSTAAADVLGTLRAAVTSRRPVTLTRVSPEGNSHRLTGVPLSMNAGRVRIRSLDDEGEAVVMLHRIAEVEEERHA